MSILHFFCKKKNLAIAIKIPELRGGGGGGGF